MTSCAEKPCLNQAKCIEDTSGGTDYQCDCQGTNYTGRHCENLEKASCEGCDNGGTCLLQKPDGFLCQCLAGFGGMRCDKTSSSGSGSSAHSNSNPCLSNPDHCENNGMCLYNAERGLFCDCHPGYEGSRCEVDLCARLNCPDNSECVQGSKCECLPGFIRSKFYHVNEW